MTVSDAGRGDEYHARSPEEMAVRYSVPPVSPERFRGLVARAVREYFDDAPETDDLRRYKAYGLCLALLESLGYGDAVDEIHAIEEAQ